MNSRVVKVVPKFKASHAIQWLPESGCTLSDVVELFEDYKITENHPAEVFLTGRRGKLMVTITQIDDRLQMYLRKGVFREIYPGFWIVVDDSMEVMILSEKEFYETHDFKSYQTKRPMFHARPDSFLDLDEGQNAWEAGTARLNGNKHIK